MAQVALIYLPSGEGGKKQGVDDYLAAGHTKDDLLALATHDLRESPREDRPRTPYRATDRGIVWERPTQNGYVTTPLTNFTARITRDVIEDDGAEVHRRFEIEATLNGRREVFSVSSSRFAGMGWATDQLGANAVVFPGVGLRDHARAAVQVLSGDLVAEHVYAHTGWRQIGEKWVYLHARGAIGQVGRVEAIRTELAGNLAGRVLPDPPQEDELVKDVRASLTLLELAQLRITAPLFSGTYRAVLGDSDFTFHISGPTGEGKSEMAALFQQHFGAGLDARHLTSWESTENAIEGQAFQSKDQLMVLDDFAPNGTSQDIQRWHRKADRVLRAKGNATGRQRMRPDTTLRPEKPPRALILSTGEDVPQGQSLRARMMVFELGPGDLDWALLTECQQDATNGLYAQAMAGFIRWLAPRYEEIRSELRAELGLLRDAARCSDQHRRTPAIVADLAMGLRYFLIFAREIGALTAEQAEKLWERGWKALGEVAAAQLQHQTAGEPTRRFRELLSAAVASGRAHVAGPDGSEPLQPQAWGWRPRGDEWQAQGERIGWKAGEDLYLEPEASFAAAQKQGRDTGEPLTISSQTLRKRLRERGLLASTDSKREVLTVRRTLGGSRRHVLHTSEDLLSVNTDQPDQPDHTSAMPHKHTALTPPLWSGQANQTRPRPDQEHRSEHDGRVPQRCWSGNDRVPDHEPDQHDPLFHAETGTSGRVGQVSQEEEDEKMERKLFSV